MSKPLTCIEICAGGGGQALGLEAAGFECRSLAEIDSNACNTLRYNRPDWKIFEGDLRDFSAYDFEGVDLLAGGVPCPPFSKAGKQLGSNDERDLFPEALRLIREAAPRAIMLENVRGFLDSRFSDYRDELRRKLKAMGYECEWTLLNACDFGVPQLRPRVVIVAMKKEIQHLFSWPLGMERLAPTVGESLEDLMAENGWKGAEAWARNANSIAPTLVGGSKKHGGADLGPTRAKRAWLNLGVDGRSLANEAPPSDFDGIPKLTLRMAARLQGFPDDWHFASKKTATYRQIGNAFPPPVARAVALQIRAALLAHRAVDSGLQVAV